jgi:hypothetical protein
MARRRMRYVSPLGRYAPGMMYYCERFELVEVIGQGLFRGWPLCFD